MQSTHAPTGPGSHARRVNDILRQELRGAVRSYLRTRGLTITILVTLGLGLGTCLASFSLVNALLLRPLGVAQPDELVRVAAMGPGDDLLRVTSGMRDGLRELPAFAGVCAVNTPGAVVGIGDQVITESIIQAAGDCFAVLGVRAQLGRVLTPEDDRAGAPVAVVTHEFWRRSLGGTPEVIGRTVAIDGASFTIVGVTEPAFRGLSTAFPTSMVAPLMAFRRGAAARAPYWCDVVARLGPGVSAAQASAQVEAAWPRLIAQAGFTTTSSSSMRRRLETSRGFVGGIRAGFENVLRPMFQQPLLITFGLSVLMLGVCAANVANLLLARGLSRRREQAVRSALGASRRDLARQAFLEAGIVMLASALFAIPLAAVITTSLVDVLRSSYLELDLPSMWDRRVAMFLAVAVLVGTCLAGLLQIVRQRGERSLADALRASARGSTGHGRSRRMLVTAQIALAVMLVGSAGTFVRALQQYYAMDPGFAVSSILAAPLSPLPGGYPAGPAAAYYQDLLANVEALPGVRSASLSTWMPLGGPSRTEPIEVVPKTPTGSASAVTWAVTDRFFETAGIVLKEGQSFRQAIHATETKAAMENDTDAASEGAAATGRTAVVSAALAERLFPQSSAVGARVRIGTDAETEDVLIIGVASDARLGKPQGTPAAVIYLNFWEDRRAQQSPYLLVRATSQQPEALASSVVSAVRARGREFPLWTRTIATQWDVALMRERLLAGTSATFGLMGLSIAAVGIFGLLSHYVTSRKAEIGIRVAIGADATDITRLLIGEVAGLVVAGVVMGLLLLWLTSRAFASLLFGVVSSDPWLLAGTVALTAFVALLALAIPLRRATSVDPLIALRSE